MNWTGYVDLTDVEQDKFWVYFLLIRFSNFHSSKYQQSPQNEVKISKAVGENATGPNHKSQQEVEDNTMT